MSDFMMFGMIGLGVVSVLFMSFVYGVYGGTRADLHTAETGQVYNFVYSQPHKGEPERYIAKVLGRRTLTAFEISKLNSRSSYRRHDPEFLRTSNLVTCQTPDGKIRNFYAERTSGCRKPLLAGTMFKVGLARLL